MVTPLQGISVVFPNGNIKGKIIITEDNEMVNIPSVNILFQQITEIINNILIPN
jgi:hypothetical protein